MSDKETRRVLVGGIALLGLSMLSLAILIFGRGMARELALAGLFLTTPLLALAGPNLRYRRLADELEPGQPEVAIPSLPASSYALWAQFGFSLIAAALVLVHIEQRYTPDGSSGLVALVIMLPAGAWLFVSNALRWRRPPPPVQVRGEGLKVGNSVSIPWDAVANLKMDPFTQDLLIRLKHDPRIYGVGRVRRDGVLVLQLPSFMPLRLHWTIIHAIDKQLADVGLSQRPNP
ncbi:hypothetical protein [Phenylobacterium deserti]|uniref:hypothetical protein n=1 Tax=Phenylobacterium deserti TaxID=1914756 RepID=UPI001057918A|nr:hypothetical protein [Phenylobacterium deserti]